MKKSNPNFSMAVKSVLDNADIDSSTQAFVVQLLSFTQNDRRHFRRLCESLSKSSHTGHIAILLRDMERALWPQPSAEANPTAAKAEMLSKAAGLLDLHVPEHICFKLIAALSVVEQKGVDFSLKDAAQITNAAIEIFGE